ncbi:MAG: methyltransferase domain-containing protein, partial [Nanoarchaeota archaeon]
MAKIDYSILQKIMVHYVNKLNFILSAVEDFQKAHPNRKLKILDVGCGVGNISLQIASNGYNVLGIDIDKASVDYANKKNKFKNCKFKVANAHDINIKEKYDVIVSPEVLEHLKHPEKLVSSIQRLLKDDGLLIITIPNGYGPTELSLKPYAYFGKFLKGIGLYEKARNLKWKLKKTSQEQDCFSSYGIDTLNTHNEGAIHEQFFTMRSFKKLLKILLY